MHNYYTYIKQLLLSVLLFLGLHTSSNAQSLYDTINVYFDINHTYLNNKAFKTLDSIRPFITSRKILVYGYADYLGKSQNNLTLSSLRAHRVKDYLIKKGVSQKQFLVCDGIGGVERNLPQNDVGFPPDRCVQIFIKREIDNTLQHKSLKDINTATNKIKVAEISPSGKLISPNNNIINSKYQFTQKVDEDTIVIKPKTLDSVPQLKNIKPIKNNYLKVGGEQSRFDELNNLKQNDVMRIESIQFQPTRHFIMKESESILLELLQTLINYPDLSIRIEGHVCCIKGDGDALDTDTFELKLSENRAKYIYQFLINNGISAERLSFIGFGKQHPIVPDEKTEEDAQKNRRVEIRVIHN